MISVPVYDIEGNPLEPVEVDEARLGDAVRLPLLRRVVHMYELNRYLGTKGHLNRSEVAGSTRKMYRQKHTGYARAGQRTVSQRRGGGLAFPPRTRDLSYRLPRKALRAAKRSALLARLRDGAVCIVESIPLESPRTRVIAGFLKAIGSAGRSLLVCDGDHTVVWKSGRNIPGLSVRRAADLNAYHLLDADRLIFTRSAFDALWEALAA